MTPEKQEPGDVLGDATRDALDPLEGMQQLTLENVQEVADAAPEPRIYVVQRGDYLEKIAKELYGDWQRWKDIYEANRDQIKDPNLIQPGQELRIPE
ncbi:MAG: LysM peptidoglycan-binding domain-containing protein [Chloroflexi bacterium]|nr:LysM peptidoglycan-binding domain-containing protein [Chloroflexota bacterium]MBU1748564.1 LysM peptidoglycan-binding domain-containing protein [Chloroflexota bacterium]MBU1878435.1 LysM peptidoglycan-binding domain-containing protein [Chloroflexota bacterium]